MGTRKSKSKQFLPDGWVAIGPGEEAGKPQAQDCSLPHKTETLAAFGPGSWHVRVRAPQVCHASSLWVCPGRKVLAGTVWMHLLKAWHRAFAERFFFAHGAHHQGGRSIPHFAKATMGSHTHWSYIAAHVPDFCTSFFFVVVGAFCFQKLIFKIKLKHAPRRGEFFCAMDPFSSFVILCDSVCDSVCL